ncbi:MAG: Flp pilus assembly complex ATPase component TadA, partial [Clostridiales bacterium]|nr:Flp pilus assembly complex ATPase component TadA [Clostridiales bacterium]
MKNIPIGEVLKEYGYINSEQLEEALLYQKEHRDKRLGAVMLELGFVDEKQMLTALAKRLDLSLTDLHEIDIDTEAVAQIPRQIAEKYKMIAVEGKDSELTVVMNDPLNFYAIEDVRQISQKNIKIKLDVLDNIDNAIKKNYGAVGVKEALKKASSASFIEKEAPAVAEVGEEAPVVQALNRLLIHSYSMGASDIHIEPFEEKMLVRVRVDGVITETANLAVSLQLSLIARIKILSDLDIAERRLPQDGHFKTKVDDVDINARVSIIPTVYGEKAVIRFLYTDIVVDDAERFGMKQENYEKFADAVNSPHGMIYITGPTGSGKTTSLYMVLERMAGRSVNISTIEDPVERNLPGVNQMQVNLQAGLTFERGLRALLRQDPDIIMVGETRDAETASISVRAAITGHLVFSTLHTNNAISAIIRLRDMGIPSYLVANSLTGLVAQRLVRKVCPDCAETYEANSDELKMLGAETARLKKPLGCTKCNHTGYRGRMAVHEV